MEPKLLIDPIRAWKLFYIDEYWGSESTSQRLRLRALTRYAWWPPAGVLEAKYHDEMGHPAPEWRCKCGIYALKQVGMQDFWPLYVLGEVDLLDKVIGTSRGYRAARARLVSLYRQPRSWWTNEVLQQVADLYDVPLMLQGGQDGHR